MRWIIGNCVTGSSKSQHTNENVGFMLWVFDDSGAPTTRFLSPWVAGEMDIYHFRDRNNKWRIKIRKVCKEVLYAVASDNTNCPILLNLLYLSLFYICMILRNTKNKNTGRRKRYCTWVVEEELQWGKGVDL